MVGVAALGFLANAASTMLLVRGRKENINVRSAFLHMMADVLGSVGAIVAGVVIWTTGWYPIDSITSVFIGLLILWSSWGLMKEATNILLEATPEGIDVEQVKQSLEEMAHVEEVHDLHIWTITSGVPVLSAHVRLSAFCCREGHWQHCLNETQAMLQESFGISHSTIQIEQPQPGCMVDT
jgi:cobalt-zinc-cadmium efflux system protein